MDIEYKMAISIGAFCVTLGMTIILFIVRPIIDRFSQRVCQEDEVITEARKTLIHELRKIREEKQ